MNFLLVRLLPIKQRIESLKAKYDVYFWCGHFHAAFDGGPTFSAKMLGDLGELGVPIFLDTYCNRAHAGPKRR